MNHDSKKEDILVEIPSVTQKDITPRELMHFAKAILSGLALLFVIGAIIEIIRPNSSVFETCKTILPPIATLVIGYYFGQSSRQ